MQAMVAYDTVLTTELMPSLTSFELMRCAILTFLDNATVLVCATLLHA